MDLPANGHIRRNDLKTIRYVNKKIYKLKN